MAWIAVCVDAERVLCHYTTSAGRVPKWPKGTDCKSVIRGFKSHRGLYAQQRGAFGGALRRFMATVRPGRCPVRGVRVRGRLGFGARGANPTPNCYLFINLGIYGVLPLRSPPLNATV